MNSNFLILFVNYWYGFSQYKLGHSVCLITNGKMALHSIINFVLFADLN